MSAYLAKSQNFALRRFREDDLELLYELEADKELKQFVGGAVSADRETWIKKAKVLCESNTQFALEHTLTGKFAGRVTLGDNTHGTYIHANCREIQLLMARDFVGQGHGNEVLALVCGYAFDGLNTECLVAVVNPAHQASLRLVHQFDFTEIDPEQSSDGQILNRVFALRRPKKKFIQIEIAS